MPPSSSMIEEVMEIACPEKKTVKAAPSTSPETVKKVHHYLLEHISMKE